MGRGWSECKRERERGEGENSRNEVMKEFWRNQENN